MKYWIDTEFISKSYSIDLVSIGVVAENGREFYAESSEVDWSKASAWTIENVRPQLDGKGMSREAIGYRLHEFTDGDERPVFWGYFPAFDWVALVGLFGGLEELPFHYPQLCLDIKQWAIELGDPELPHQKGNRHHALLDARWTREVWAFLASLHPEGATRCIVGPKIQGRPARDAALAKGGGRHTLRGRSPPRPVNAHGATHEKDRSVCCVVDRPIKLGVNLRVEVGTQGFADAPNERDLVCTEGGNAPRQALDSTRSLGNDGQRHSVAPLCALEDAGGVSAEFARRRGPRPADHDHNVVTEQFKARACELTGWPQPIVGEGRGAQRGKSDVGSRPVVAEREAATADNRLPPIDPYDRCRAGSGNDEAALGPGMSADARGRRVIGGPGQRKMAK